MDIDIAPVEIEAVERVEAKLVVVLDDRTIKDEAEIKGDDVPVKEIELPAVEARAAVTSLQGRVSCAVSPGAVAVRIVPFSVDKGIVTEYPEKALSVVGSPESNPDIAEFYAGLTVLVQGLVARVGG